MAFGRLGSMGRGFGKLGGGSGSGNVIIPGRIVVAAGSYSWSGDDMTPLQDHIISAGGGSYAWTGTDASFVRNRLIGATGGSYTYTGQDATLTKAAGASFSLTYQSQALASSTTSPISYGGGTLSWGAGYTIVIIEWYGGSGTPAVSQVSVGGSTAFTLVARAFDAGSTDHVVEIWQSNSTVSASSGAVTITYSSNPSYNSVVSLYTLVTTTPTASATSTIVQISNTASYSFGAVTIPSGGGAVFGGFAYSGATQSITSGNAAFDSSPLTTGGTNFIIGHTTATGSQTVTIGMSPNDSGAAALVAWGP